MSGAGQTRDRGMVGRAPWIAGLIFALAAAVCFASIPSLARLAYDGGSDPLTVAFLRSLMGSLALVMMILIFRRPILLPRKAWPLTFLATLSWFVTNVSYLAAVFYLPVGLACLLLYCFPFVAAALLPLSGAGDLGARGFGAGLLALVGLGLAVATVYGELDPQGLLFALLAAVGASITVLVSRAAPCCWPERWCRWAASACPTPLPAGPAWSAPAPSTPSPSSSSSRPWACPARTGWGPGLGPGWAPGWPSSPTPSPC